MLGEAVNVEDEIQVIVNRVTFFTRKIKIALQHQAIDNLKSYGCE